MKVSLISLLTILLVALIYLDISGDYKEIYKIESAEFRVFEISSFDTANNCYLIRNMKSIESVPDSVIIGIRFKVDFLNIKKEWLWETFFKHYPDGGKGHIDTIKSINLQFVSNDKNDYSGELKNASAIQSFQIEGEELMNHSLNSWNMCGVPLNFPSISSFIEYYNLTNKKTAKISDFIFFKIDNKKLLTRILNDGAILKFTFLDGTIINAYYEM